MKNNVARRTVVIALAMAFAGIVPSAYAQHCSFAGAAGRYADSDSGTIIGIGPRPAVGLVTLNAAGQVSGQVTASLNGSITQNTLSGTYTVNPDCSGAINFSEFDQAGNLVLTATANVVWDEDMREVRFVFTSVALANRTPLVIVINGEGRKINPRSDNDSR